MPFHVSVIGEAPLPAVPVDDFPERVIIACLDELEHEGAKITARSAYSVTYRKPFFRLGFDSGWWLPVLAPTGTFEVHPSAPGGAKVTYRLSLLRHVAIGAVAPLFFLLIPEARFAVIPAWLWLLGAPYLVAFFRARQWTRKRIEEATRIAMPRLEESRRAVDRLP